MAENGVNLGKAFIQILPSAQGIAGSITKVLSGEADRAGQSAGLNIANAIKAAIAAAGIGAAVHDAVNAGMGFDAEMSHVAAISGATADEFNALREKALEMGAQTKFSASESASAFSYMAMAGWDAQQMMSGISGVMSLAAADGLDLATTSDIVTDALTAFGLSAADSSHFADVLAVASSSANTNVALMGETFKYVAPIAGAMGVNIEDTAEAIGLMANAGIKGSQAGTELRSVLTRLATNAGASKNSLGALDVLVEKLGVEFYESNGEVRDFSDVLSEARVAWTKLSAAEQTDYGKIIAGQEAMSGWLALMNAAPADIAKLETALANADGTAERMAAIMQDNLPGAITIFKSAVEGLQIAVYDKFSEPMKNAVKSASEFVGLLTDAVRTGDLEPLKEYGVNLARKIWSGIVTGVPEAAGHAVKFLAHIGKALIQNAPVLLEYAKNLLTTVWDGIITYAPILGGKILDLVSFIGGLIVQYAPILLGYAKNLLTTVWDGIITYAPVLGGKILDLVSFIGGLIVQYAPMLLESGRKLAGNLIAGIRETAPKAAAAFYNLLPPEAQAFLSQIAGFFAPLLDIFQQVSDTALAVFPTVADSVTGAFIRIRDALSPLLERFAEWVARVSASVDVGKLLSDAVIILGAGIATAADILATAVEWLAGFVGWLTSGSDSADLFIAAVLGLVAGFTAFQTALAVTSMIQKAIAAFTALKTSVAAVNAVLLANPIAAVIAAVAALAVGIIYLWNTNEGFRDAVKEIWENIVGFFKGAWDAIKAVWDAVKPYFVALWDEITGLFSDALEIIKALFTALVESIKFKLELIAAAFKLAWEAIQLVWEKAKPFFEHVWNDIKIIFSVVKDVLGEHFKLAWTAIKAVWSVAVSFFQAIWDSIRGIFAAVAGVLTGDFRGAWEGIHTNFVLNKLQK